MNSSLFLSVTTFIYGLAALLYLVAWVFTKEKLGMAAFWVTVSGVFGNSLGIILRWVESYQAGIGHAPLSDRYESLVFFALTIALVYLYVERRYKIRSVGVFATPLAFLSMAYAGLAPDQIQPLLPALKSNWLIAHVVTCFIGYASFSVAFGISILYLIKVRRPENDSRLLSAVPAADILDELTHQMVVLGFLFLTAGIITGAVWANSAWGSYWSWDPKETWSLITWFIYATLLHARLVRGWHGNRIAWLSIVGFVAVMFTYFGVNYLPGLHSYGQ